MFVNLVLCDVFVAQPIGGSTHVDKGSSLEFLGDVSFLGNTLAYLTDPAWVRFDKTLSGAAITRSSDLFWLGFHSTATLRNSVNHIIVESC